MLELENNYSAVEHVFSIPDLRLYILQYSIGEYPKKQTIRCRDKIKEKIDRIIFNFTFTTLSCFYPGIPRGFIR
tara:strand:+ start:1548 stop:1769 length:222 start_codon:yes stop_codon:yes gene_type:complete